MNNKIVFPFAFSLLLLSVFGCSYYNPLAGGSDSAANDNRTLSDKAIESTVGETKIGVPECDEIMDFFNAQSKSENDDFVTKAAREYAFNTIRESFKQSIEENKGDKESMAKECRKFKVQLDKYKAEDDAKKQR